MLTQLIGVIKESHLAVEDKNDALKETQAIVEAKAEEPEKQKSLVAKALRSLKRFGSDLHDAPEVLATFSDLIAKISQHF